MESLLVNSGYRVKIAKPAEYDELEEEEYKDLLSYATGDILTARSYFDYRGV
jgi:hypothetical protein